VTVDMYKLLYGDFEKCSVRE